MLRKTVTLTIKLTVQGDTLTDEEIREEFVNELDYEIKSTTDGVKVVEMEITDSNWGEV